jgi:hypothetical protein
MTSRPTQLETEKMARYGKESKLKPETILREGVAFFGPEGLGLEIKEHNESCARLEGGGGHVVITVCEKGNGSEVTLETREWDYQTQKFLEKI